MSTGLTRLLDDRRRSQREKLGLLADHWRGELERLDDDALVEALAAIRKAINSKKLRVHVDALIGSLRRDGAEGCAPLPKRRPRPADPVETRPITHAPDEPHRDPKLEARIAARPRERDGYLVYRDWLEGRGLVVDGRVSLGPLADCDDMLGGLEWQHGFIRAARLQYTGERFNGVRPELSVEQALTWLLDDPGPGRLIERLTIGLVRHDDNDYSGVCRVIGARARPTLVELELGDFGYEECELNWSTIGDASPLWSALPNLRKLHLRAGSMSLDGIDLPELRELETVTGGMPAAALRAIAGANWPKLERLSLQIGLAEQGAATDVALVDPILAGDKFPALVHLGLCNCEFTDELCARLASAPILARLRTLDLSMGVLSMAGVEAMTRAPHAFSRLERIDVDDNYLPEQARALLEGLGPEIVFGSQREDDGEYRYASAYE